MPFAEIKSAMDAAADPQAVHAGAIVDSAIPEMPKTLAAPFSLADVSLPPARPAPALGAHSADVLAEAGVSADEIAALKSSGAIG